MGPHDTIIVSSVNRYYEDRSTPFHTKLVRWGMEWLQQCLDATKRTQADLARHLEIPPSRVSEMVAGTRRIQQREIMPLVDFLGIELVLLTRLMAGDAKAVEEVKALFPLPETTMTPAGHLSGKPDVPVWASAAAGKDGAMVLVNDPIDWISRSDRLKGVKDPFAFHVIGQSMSPAIDHGDQVVINPALKPIAGKDHVFIQTQADGTILALVKRLLRSTGSAWQVRQFNPVKDFDLPKSKWEKALRISEKRVE